MILIIFNMIRSFVLSDELKKPELYLKLKRFTGLFKGNVST